MFADRPVRMTREIVLAYAPLMACVIPGGLPRPKPSTATKTSWRKRKKTHDRRQQRLITE
jgi:hypothetical protein